MTQSLQCPSCSFQFLTIEGLTEHGVLVHNLDTERSSETACAAGREAGWTEAVIKQGIPSSRSASTATRRSSGVARPRSPKEAKAGKMICPHCQTKGQVRTRQVKQKKGVSGGKATAAVVTAGWSLLGTGLSRKEKMTEARCNNCGAIWHY